MIRRILPKLNFQSLRSISESVQNKCDIPVTDISSLDNGFRIVTENWDTRTSTVGVWINAGSRYETLQNNGVAHFLEHMAFKGTNKRTQHSLELEVETKGAHLNAYTSREMTVYYFKCLNKDMEWAIELLSDILRNSKFENKFIERERGVILREMEEIESTYQEVVFDHLHASAFVGSSLGQTILGPEENIRSIGRADLRSFIDFHYRGPNMMLCAVGGLPHEDIVQMAQHHFGDLSAVMDPTTMAHSSFLTSHYTGADSRVLNNRLPQAYLAFASQGPGWTDTDTLPLMIACSVNGSWDRNHGGMGQAGSTLATSFFRGGTVNSFQNFFTCYHDTSLWGIYLTCDGAGLATTAETVLHEWMRLCSEISNEEVERAKNSLKTNLLLMLDGTTPVCEEIGRHMITYNRRIPPDEMVYRIDQVTSQQVRSTCEKYIRNRDLSVASVGPVEGLPPYEVMRRRLHW